MPTLSPNKPGNLDIHANTRSVPSSSFRVGDLVLLEKDQRVLVDMILLHISDSSGMCFIRTGQLDGETDWKLRVAVPECQKLDEGDLIRLDAEIYGATKERNPSRKKVIFALPIGTRLPCAILQFIL